GNNLYLIDGRNGSLIRTVRGIAYSSGDVNGDSTPDIVFGLSNGNLLLLDGRSLRELWMLTDLKGAKINSVEIGDFDGDGYSEILAGQLEEGRIVLYCLDGKTVHLNIVESFDEGPFVLVSHDSNYTLTLIYGNRTLQIPPNEKVKVNLAEGGKIFGNHSIELQLTKEGFILDSRKLSALIPLPKLTASYSWEETSLKLSIDFPYPWKFGLKVLEGNQTLLEDTILPGSVEKKLTLSPGKRVVRVVIMYSEEVVTEDELDLELIPKFEVIPSGSTIKLSVDSPVVGNLELVVDEGAERVYSETVPSHGESSIDLDLDQGDHTLTVRLLYDGEELASKVVKTYVPPSPVPFIAAAAAIVTALFGIFLIKRYREHEAEELEKILEVTERPVQPSEPLSKEDFEIFDDFEVLSVEKPARREVTRERPAPSEPRRPMTASSLELEVGGQARLIVDRSRTVTPGDLSLPEQGLIGKITLIKQPDGRWSLKVTGTRAMLNGTPVNETLTYLITSGDLLDIWGVRIIIRFRR
ncbi:MAG: VCBS repeat-containing protein, partial [Candidatus Korarchaeota archaeon]|nr:VCBS repeat-containing protein [Candidatus Korarchaeota archaeon]